MLLCEVLGKLLFSFDFKLFANILFKFLNVEVLLIKTRFFWKTLSATVRDQFIFGRVKIRNDLKSLCVGWFLCIRSITTLVPYTYFSQIVRFPRWSVDGKRIMLKTCKLVFESYFDSYCRIGFVSFSEGSPFALSRLSFSIVFCATDPCDLFPEGFCFPRACTLIGFLMFR